MLDRIPPQNIEAEQCVLGAMLIEREAIIKAADILQADDFYRQDHRVIFEAIMALFNKNEAVDLVTVTEELKHLGKLADIGGVTTITSLSNVVPTAANVIFHAKIVEDKALRRKLIYAATDIVTNGYEEEEDVSVVLDNAEKKILDVGKGQSTGDFSHIKTVIEEAMDRIDKLYGSQETLTGLSTGFRDFDQMTSGLQPSDLVIVAARPSMGKSTIVLNMAQYAAIKQGKSVAFFSLEMSKDQLVQRMLCAEAGIDASKLRIGQLSDEDWTNLMDASDRLSHANIYLDDTPAITGMEMRAKARRLKHEAHGLDMIIVDYLQLMQSSGKRGVENRQQELSEISRSLKALGRELSVPVVALSQLSRSVEQRPNKRPMLSDLRESGALEQDADIVAFLYRDAYYNPDTEDPSLTEFIIAKHRNGPVGTVKLIFQAAYTRFANRAPDYRE